MKTKTSKSKGKSKGRTTSTTRTLLLPKFFQPKLDLVQQVDCKLAHWDLITRISSGKATTTAPMRPMSALPCAKCQPPPDIRDTPPAPNVSPPLTLETQPVCQMSAKQRIEPMELID